MCRILAFPAGPKLPPARTVGPAAATDAFRRVARDALPERQAVKVFPMLVYLSAIGESGVDILPATATKDFYLREPPYCDTGSCINSSAIHITAPMTLRNCIERLLSFGRCGFHRSS